MAAEMTYRNGDGPTPRFQRRQSLEQLWQVPTFFVGLAALALAWAGHSFCKESSGHTFERKLAAARQALDDIPLQPRKALALAEELLPHCDEFVQHAGEVHYLLGSSQLLVAADSTDSAPLYKDARTHLEKAESLGVPNHLRNKLTYRLGKALFHTAAEPQKIINLLKASVDQAGDESAEGYGMLAQTYLRLRVPDLQAALDANKKQLALANASDEAIAPARLLHGELLLRLKEPEQARKMLARISTSADPGIRSKARYLQARSCQEEGLWSEAAKLWNQLLADADAKHISVGRMHWYLGLCYRELGRAPEAAKEWEAALEQTGPESKAAVYGLAELRVNGGMPATAFELFERALRDEAGETCDYPDGQHVDFESLVELKEKRRIVERGILRYREVGDFDRSMRLAKLYEKIGVANVPKELRGQAADAWANERRAAHSENEARKHFQEAGEAYEEVAECFRGPAQAQWLRRSSDRFIQAQAFANALKVLKKFLEAETAPEQLAGGWFAIAQVYHALYDEPAASAAYRKCIEFPGTSAYQARFKLALVDIEKNRLDEAEEALKQNLELMRLTPDDETYKTTLFTLAGLHYKRANYRAAALRYQEALDRFPADNAALEARHQVADCYRRLAALENQNLAFVNLTTEAQRHYRDQYRLWLKMAVANYQKLADDLAARQTTTPLTAAEEAILRQADFAIGDCRIDLGQYEDAIRHHEILAARYHHQVEQLQALRQIWRCYFMTRDPDKARDIVKQVQTILPELDDRLFASQPTKQCREDWLDWIKWAEKQ